MRRWALLLIGAAVFGGVAGCGHTQDYLSIAREQGISEEYLRVLDHWTRSQIVYSQFETVAHIRATYRSPEFDRAYRREFEKIYHVRAGETKARPDIPELAAADFAEFFCYAYTPEKASNDFDRRGSIWTIFLVKADGERVYPAEVRKIDPVTPVTNAFFPYINQYYGNSYRLRFPPVSKKEGTAGPFKLVFASVLGEVALEFAAR
jgi:hypothetical protein